MEKLALKFNTLKKLIVTFERSITLFQNKKSDEDIARIEAYTASVIKHFELFYEVFWKYLKLYLLEKFGVETLSSKSVFRSCQHRIINDDELDALLKMVDDRNMATQVYDEDVANETAVKIITHYQVIKSILKKLN